MSKEVKCQSRFLWLIMWGGDTGMKAIGGRWRVQVRIACREVLVTHTGLGFS